MLKVTDPDLLMAKRVFRRMKSCQRVYPTCFEAPHSQEPPCVQTHQGCLQHGHLHLEGGKVLCLDAKRAFRSLEGCSGHRIKHTVTFMKKGFTRRVLRGTCRHQDDQCWLL